ncbi:MAG: hypothetical protein MO853_12835 [Candidatus Protistobacter heckmanni]|nr:hypothetical protein [Candidatus Protistobacter heckmanni]
MLNVAALAPAELLVPPGLEPFWPARGELLALSTEGLREWLEDAALRAQGLACHCLALMYEHGHGCERDLRKALAMFERAIAAGVPEAAYRLGPLYLQANGAVGEVVDGTELLRTAAGLGVARAAHMLGRTFFRDELVERNFSRGYLYLLLAAELGHDDSKRPLVIIQTMYPQEGFHWEKGQVDAILRNVPSRLQQFRSAAKADQRTAAARGLGRYPLHNPTPRFRAGSGMLGGALPIC